MSSKTPSSNGDSGHNGRLNGSARKANGQFGEGNKLGRGNPHAKHINKLRSVLIEATTPQEMKAVCLALIAKAKEGDVPAIKELFDRLFGKAVALHDIETKSDIRKVIELIFDE